MTDRKTASTITDAELDQLYDRLQDDAKVIAHLEDGERLRLRAEAAIARARALANRLDSECPWTSSAPGIADEIRTALDGPTPLTDADGRTICTCTYATPCGCGTSVHYQPQEPTP